MKKSIKHFPRVYLWPLGFIIVIGLVWFIGKEIWRDGDTKSNAIERQFNLSNDFAISLIAAEPDIMNPMSMCVDEKGRIFVTESTTYRYSEKSFSGSYGILDSSLNEKNNPIKCIELGTNGRPVNITVAAEGFPNPVIGVYAYEGKLYATCLNELFVMDIGPHGELTNRKLLVSDAAVPWNPFGMYRVIIGPDAKIWLAIADHPQSIPVELTGTDGRKLRLNGQSGGLVRCNLDGSGLELMVEGFRAPFAFDIDPWGHLWVVSNGEGSPNIFVNVIPGMDYGYHSRNVSYAWLAGKTALSPPVHEMESGAYTSSLFYYSSMFPHEFWGNIFMSNYGNHGANPSNRNVELFLRQRDGQDVSGTAGTGLFKTSEPFLTTTDSFFRPTCIINAPDGGLYLADWHSSDDESNKLGRIFKIIYTGKNKPTVASAPSQDLIKRMKPIELCGLLGNPNRFTRELVQRALIQADTTVLEPLGQILEKGSAFAAANAIWTLTQMKSVAATRTMALALKHPDARVRAFALRQLRQAAGLPLGGTFIELHAKGFNSLDKLLKMDTLVALALPLVHDPDGEVRVEAALALNSSEAITRGLLSALEIVTGKRLQYQIGFELGIYGDSATLEKLHTSSSPDLQRVAFIAAETARDKNIVLANAVKDWNLAQADQNATESLVAKLLSGKSRLTETGDRLMVLEWLQEHPQTPTKPLMEFLLACLKDEDRDSRVQAAALSTVRQSALHSADIKSATLHILHDTKKQGAPVQLEALYTLGSFADPGRPEEWLPWLKDSSKAFVIATLRSLRERERSPGFMKVLWPAAIASAEHNPFLAEEVWFTFRQLGVPEDHKLELPSRPTDKKQLAQIILSRLKSASPQRGKWSFAMTCATCHSVVQSGELRLGPNLASIGANSQTQYLIESVLEPSKIIKTGFEMVTIQTKDGHTFTGQVASKDKNLIIRRFGSESLTIPLSEVKSRTISRLSPMPEGLDNGKTVEELADLIAYLISLKGNN